MSKQFIFFCAFFVLFFDQTAYAQEESADKHTVYVSSISWHTGIVVPAYIFPDTLWKETTKYPEDSYLEIGWGDADFYTDEGFNLWFALKAVFWPTPSVLHINPIQRKVETYYSNTKVVRMDLTDKQLKKLGRYLVDAFALDENGKVIPYAEGIYPSSIFFKGSSSYYFPNNSNVWAARAIKKTGFPIHPIWLQTTGAVLNKVEKFGELVVDKK